MRKNLVLAVVGDSSVHTTWLTGNSPRSFDLCLIYYGDAPNRFAPDADFYFEGKGIKFALTHELAQNGLADILFRYNQVWMPDDDIAADTIQINQLFDLAAQYRLAICQPAIGRGDVTYRGLRAQPGFILRYSPFIEMMCPLFSREALRKTLPTFNANRSGWGLDWLWPTFFGRREVAILDAVPVHHTRPLKSGDLYRLFTAEGIRPTLEHRQLLAAHHINDRRARRRMVRGTTIFRGLRTDGREVWTQPLWSNLWRRKAA